MHVSEVLHTSPIFAAPIRPRGHDSTPANDTQPHLRPDNARFVCSLTLSPDEAASRPMAPICGLCHEHRSKYRCPTCDVRCSLVCYKPHKAGHEAEKENAHTEQPPSQTLRDRPGTTQRVPKVDFTGLEDDSDFKRLLTRFPSLKLQLGVLYGLTLEPGPDDARTWNRQPLPGFTPPPAPPSRGRGRGRGRSTTHSRGNRQDIDSWRNERERGPWTSEKGDKEALSVMQKMRSGIGEDHEAAEGMREFSALCRIKFAQPNGEA